MVESTNARERRRWNDPYWAGVWPRREQLTGAVTPILLEHLRLSRAERVLDIGSGAGITSLAAARIVGPDGEVVGADISEPLVAFATRRAEAEGVTNVRFVVSDAQEASIDGAPYDVAMSQFGVMFFDNPVSAFANIRAHLHHSGRLGFACWRVPEDNPWHIGNALVGLVPPPAPPEPGKSPTGPFSLGDPGRTIALLEAAGFSHVQRTPYDLVANVGKDAIVDDEQLRFLGVPPDRIEDASAAVAAHLAKFARADGRYDAPLAIQVFTAAA